MRNPDESFDDTVIVLDDYRWDRSNLVLVCDILVLVDIDFLERDAVAPVLFEFVNDRVLCFTGPAPVGVEVFQTDSHLYDVF